MNHRNRSRFFWCLLLAAALGTLGHLGLLDVRGFWPAVKRLGIFSRDLFPPDTAAFGPLAWAMLETVEIAFAGTLVGLCLAMPLAFFGSRSLFGPGASTVARTVVGILRTVPSILFGVVFVVALGLGPAAGVMGVAFYTVGYLGKLYYEAFEGVDPEVLEAVRATGANPLQLFRFAILPESANATLSQLFFMFEYNIRASSIMGFVGAGGIGYYMLGYVQMLQYRHLLSALVLTFAVVMAVDALSLRVRTTLLPAAFKK